MTLRPLRVLIGFRMGGEVYECHQFNAAKTGTTIKRSRVPRPVSAAALAQAVVRFKSTCDLSRKRRSNLARFSPHASRRFFRFALTPNPKRLSG